MGLLVQSGRHRYLVTRKPLREDIQYLYNVRAVMQDK